MAGESSVKAADETLAIEGGELIPVSPDEEGPLAPFVGGMVVVAELHPEIRSDLSGIADLVEITHEIPLPVRVPLPSGGRRDPPRPPEASRFDEISAVRAIPARPATEPSEPPAALAAPALNAVARGARVDDSRMRDAELLVGQGRWARVVESLAPVEGIPTPPGLLMLHAIALRECEVAGESTGQHPSRDAGRLALEAIAGLLGVAPTSPVAVLVARRILRRTWHQTPAPPPRTSLLIVVAGVALGALVGWFLGPGKGHLLHLLHLLHWSTG